MADHEHIAADHHASEHAEHHAVHAAEFTASEIAHFQSEDYSAGKAVVLLMLGIFCSGVVLYSIVAYSVMA